VNEHQIDRMKARLLEQFLAAEIDREVLSDAIELLERCRLHEAHQDRLINALAAEIAYQRACGPT
jgi:hypothetical protein